MNIDITPDLPLEVKVARYFLRIVLIIACFACVVVGGFLMVTMVAYAFSEHFSTACWVTGITAFMVALYKAIEVSETHNILTGNVPQESEADKLMRRRGDK